MSNGYLMMLWMLIMLSGLCVAVWGYSKSDKKGYLFVAVSFILALLMFFLTMPFMGAGTADPEVQAKINEAVTEILQAENAGSGVIVQAAIRIQRSVAPSVLFLLASALLVIGLWLLAWVEPTDEPEIGNEVS